MFVLSLLIAYFVFTGPLRDNFKDAAPPTTKEQSYFVASMVLLYAVKGSPIDLLSHLSFSAHMVQMALLYLVIPPLVIKGIPNWLWRGILRIPPIHFIFKLAAKPLVAIILFNFVFSMYHMPVVFETVKSHWFYHGIMTTTIFILALLMWWPMLTTIQEWMKLSHLQKIGCIFLGGVLLTPACALLIFADVPLYSTYTDPDAWAQALALCVPADVLASANIGSPEMFQWLPVQEDQQLGGVLMKIMQEIVYGIVLFRVFFAWFNRENRKVDELPEEYRLTEDPQPTK